MIKTIRSVQHEMPVGSAPIPQGFALNGWFPKLPIATIIILNEIIALAYAGLNAEETIAAIEVAHANDKEPLFFDFNAPAPKTKKKRAIYEEDRERELYVKETLEGSGYEYPQSLRDLIGLLESFDMVHRIPIGDGGHNYDVILFPFPRVAGYLG